MYNIISYDDCFGNFFLYYISICLFVYIVILVRLILNCKILININWKELIKVYFGVCEKMGYKVD